MANPFNFMLGDISAYRNVPNPYNSMSSSDAHVCIIGRKGTGLSLTLNNVQDLEDAIAILTRVKKLIDSEEAPKS